MPFKYVAWTDDQGANLRAQKDGLKGVECTGYRPATLTEKNAYEQFMPFGCRAGWVEEYADGSLNIGAWNEYKEEYMGMIAVRPLDIPVNS